MRHAHPFNMHVPISFLPNFLLSQLNERRCSILSLPFDIHIDHIFIHLLIEDIISLRRVNKMFYLLTHEPIVWRRFLERMNIPVPPLRPTFRYSEEATDYEIEQLVTQAISLDDNWRNNETVVKRDRLLLSDHTILGLQLLPGGKYLVASERDELKYRYFLTIYALHYPSGPLALARTEIGTKAFHIRAKYMEFEGRMCIMTSFIRRKFKKNLFVPGVTPSDFGVDTDIDPPVPFRHELVCLHTCLQALEWLSDPMKPRGSDLHIERINRLEPPFNGAAIVVSSRRIEGHVLYARGDRCYVAYIEQPDAVHIYDIESKQTGSLTLGNFGGGNYQNKPHRIEAIRILPEQGDILILRTVKVADYVTPDLRDLGAIEIYALPKVGSHTATEAKETAFIYDKTISKFYVSDAGSPTITPDHPRLRPNCGPPPPISIYLRTEKPIGIVHFTIWPTHVKFSPDKTSYIYSLDIVTQQSTHISDPCLPHILPGAHRAVIYYVPSDDRREAPSFVCLRRYINPCTRPADYELPDDDLSNVLRSPRKTLPGYIFTRIGFSPSWREILEEKGVGAITWDEGTGRVLISADGDKYIRILDFADLVLPEHHFRRDKQKQQQLFQSLI